MKTTLAKRLARRAAAGLLLAGLAALGLVTPVGAASPYEAPPIPAGQSRIWFLRQLLPGENQHAPMLYVNGAPIAVIASGTTFYRDFVPGQYAFSVENCLPQRGAGQTMTLQPGAQYALQISQDDNGAWDCIPQQVSYLRQVPPPQVPYLFAQVTYQGAR
jgi:hypothetical protein